MGSCIGSKQKVGVLPTLLLEQDRITIGKFALITLFIEHIDLCGFTIMVIRLM
jgi:hypothetical protein